MKKTYQWPDNYQVPAWLPNWKNPDEYARLTIQVSYSFKHNSSDSCDVVALSPNETLHIRRADRDALVTLKQETPKVDFAWEFLRRNPEYQAEYQLLVEQAQKDDVIERYQSGTGLCITKYIDESRLPPSLSFHAAFYRTLAKWGLAAWLPDPSQDLHDAPPLQALSRIGVDCWESEAYFMDQGEPIPYDGGIILTDTEESFIFDISRPLAPQLQHAKEVFEAAQIHELIDTGFVELVCPGGILNGRGRAADYTLGKAWRTWQSPPPDTRNIAKARAARKKK